MLVVSHWILSDSKSPQVSRTLLSILADLNNAVAWNVSTCPPISKSSTPITNTFGIVPGASTTIGITVTFMFQSFFSPLPRSRYSYLFSLVFMFTLRSVGTEKSALQLFSFFSFFFFFCLLSFGLVFWPRLGDSFLSKNHRELFASHSPGRDLGGAYISRSNGQI